MDGWTPDVRLCEDWQVSKAKNPTQHNRAQPTSFFDHLCLVLSSFLYPPTGRATQTGPKQHCQCVWPAHLNPHWGVRERERKSHYPCLKAFYSRPGQKPAGAVVINFKAVCNKLSIYLVGSGQLTALLLSAVKVGLYCDDVLEWGGGTTTVHFTFKNAVCNYTAPPLYHVF